MATYEERIRRIRSALSPSFERLAGFLLDSYAEAAMLTATEIAHQLDVDTGTVVRFAQRLGYRGYPELQDELQDHVRRDLLLERAPEPDSPAAAADQALRGLAKAMTLTRRTFPTGPAEELILALDQAQRVVVLAEGLALAPARDLCAWLEAAGYSIHLAGPSLSGLARGLSGARRGDLLIVIEVDEETPYLREAISEARQGGIRTAAIVSAASARAAQTADIVLVAHKIPDPAAGPIMVEAVIYGFKQMLVRSRPGRFGSIEREVNAIKRRLAGKEGG
jgi:DNA-binding MurR/RpiR family transcriptional regulator